MKLHATQDDALPKLAWLAKCFSDRVVLMHGNAVEVWEDGWLEGAWAGEFADKSFDRCAEVFGSGGLVKASGRVVIVPSATTTNYCYFGVNANGAYEFSNSMPLLLASLGQRLIPLHREYLAINDSLLKGYKRYQSEIPTDRGVIRRLVFWNAVVEKRSILLEDKPSTPEFGSYEEYREYIGARYQEIAVNARSLSRKCPLKIYSTQSKGYDSTAMNAIAASSGLDAVFTILQGKGQGLFADTDKDVQVDDSGTEIGRYLGFSCTPMNRRAIEGLPDSEYLYYCSVHAGEDMNLSETESLIKSPGLLLTGCIGEITAPWDYYYRYYGNSETGIGDLERADHGTNGLGEVRLETGFIDLPLFYIGARARRSIANIAASDQMQRWRLGTNYDRPIARRIAEEAGVPREIFGQRKSATVTVYTPPQLPLSSALRQEYKRYLVDNGVLSGIQLLCIPLVHRFNRVSWFVSPKRFRLLYYFERLVSKAFGRQYHLPIIWHWVNNALFAFCVNKRVTHYSMCLPELADNNEKRLDDQPI